MLKKMITKELVRKVDALMKERLTDGPIVSLSQFRDASLKNKKRSVLLIENDSLMRGAIKDIFEQDDYQVVGLADGTELSTVVDSTKFELIIINIDLPIVSGYELATLFRDSYGVGEVPIVFIGNSQSDSLGFDEAVETVNSVHDLIRLKKSIENHFVIC